MEYIHQPMASIFTMPHFASVTIKSFTILKPSLTSLCHAYLIMLIQFLCVRHVLKREHRVCVCVPRYRPRTHCTNLKYTSILIAANWIIRHYTSNENFFSPNTHLISPVYCRCCFFPFYFACGMQNPRKSSSNSEIYSNIVNLFGEMQLEVFTMIIFARSCRSRNAKVISNAFWLKCQVGTGAAVAHQLMHIVFRNKLLKLSEPQPESNGARKMRLHSDCAIEVHNWPTHSNGISNDI